MVRRLTWIPAVRKVDAHAIGNCRLTYYGKDVGPSRMPAAWFAGKALLGSPMDRRLTELRLRLPPIHFGPRMQFRSRLLLLAFPLVAPPLAAESNWAQWRGPLFNGSNPSAANLAIEWGATQNIVWKTALPSWSAATPVVWDDFVFVISAQEGFDPRRRRSGRRGASARGANSNDAILLLALSRLDGTILWRRSIGQGNRVYRKHNLASPSPITDGRRVWAMTGNGDLSCHDFDGDTVWKRNLQSDYGRFGMAYGYASTPRLHKERLYVQVIHGMETDQPAYVLAIDAATGKTLWRVERPTDAEHQSRDGYSTPLIVASNGQEQLLVAGADYATGHDLASGQELWRMDGLNPERDRFYRTIASSIRIGETIFTPSKLGKPFIAYRASEAGRNDGSAMLWENSLGADIPSPTTDGKRIFVVNDRGILNVLDPQTGELLVERLRLTPGFYYASPLLADGKLYATNEGGTTTVVDVEDGYRILATNRLESHTLASLVAVGDQLFQRTEDHLYCIASDR